jgi:hypothetical protein
MAAPTRPAAEDVALLVNAKDDASTYERIETAIDVAETTLQTLLGRPLSEKTITERRHVKPGQVVIELATAPLSNATVSVDGQGIETGATITGPLYELPGVSPDWREVVVTGTTAWPGDNSDVSLAWRLLAAIAARRFIEDAVGVNQITREGEVVIPAADIPPEVLRIVGRVQKRLWVG